MSVPVLTTKLFIPPQRPQVVLRPRLIDRFNKVLQCRLGLISAAAGCGKTTLVSQWLETCGCRAAWISLDEEHRDPARFLSYVIAALQSLEGGFGTSLLTGLQSPQSPRIDAVLTHLINELTLLREPFVLVLDDYHVLGEEEIDRILAFFLENMPSSMHLVVMTREDPRFPLARLRAKGGLVELRGPDLRFTREETEGFFQDVMHLNLPREEVEALESRTEGWIAGLQLAAISIQDRRDTAGFIASFTGSHHFVLDYLMEEVLHRQPRRILSFLLRTSLLERMCGPLCDALFSDPPGPGQEVLAYLEQSNMFIVPLDQERRWYRYHHLFGELLRQRLRQSSVDSAALHQRASGWYEEQGLHLEAFHHSVAAGDVDRTTRLIEGQGIPRSSRSTVTAILHWLESLPPEVMERRPLLWVSHASVLLGIGRVSGVEEKLLCAEKALGQSRDEGDVRDMRGRIASMRAILGLTRYDPECMEKQSLDALVSLSPENLAFQSASLWTLGIGAFMQKKRAAAEQAFSQAVSLGARGKNLLFPLLAEAGLGDLRYYGNHLRQAKQIYDHVLQIAGDQPLPVLCDVYLHLAEISYQWDEMDKAMEYARKSIQLARLFEDGIDRFILCEISYAYFMLFRGETDTAAALADETARSVHQHRFLHRMPELAALRIRILLRRNQWDEAFRLAEEHRLPLEKARIFLARGEYESALTALMLQEQERDPGYWDNQALSQALLQSQAYQGLGRREDALEKLLPVLHFTEPEGHIRLYVEEGEPMAGLLSCIAPRGIMSEYITALLDAFGTERERQNEPPPGEDLFVEPLSPREREVLNLIAQGYSNKEIGEILFLALDTVKGHNRRIFGKLGVKTRTMAVAKARSFRLLDPVVD